MKGRSQRLPITEPSDDWVDGSWTVDCVCGVNFDDGEEMVNCDECGVWVHTRCSRFVKGETSFACDKCKIKKSKNDNNEETEVAQLLIELPTKTMRMENACPPSAPPPRPFRLWTEIPIEDRAHVQGLPGGEPTLFQGLSSVFTSELWKCTGYVPKKFNFQYREFPCWNEKEGVNARSDEENESPVDRGADALFSLSKDIVSANPVEMLVGLRGSVEAVGCERKLSTKEMKKQEGKESSVGRIQNGVKRERNRLRPFGVHSGKRKKDDMGGSKDQTGKKKARSADNEEDNKKSASTPAIDGHKIDFCEDGGFNMVKTHLQDTKNDDRREVILPDPISDACFEENNNMDKPKDNLAAKAHHSEDFSREATAHISLIETVVKSEYIDHQAPVKPGSSPKIEAVAVSLIEPNGVGCAPIKVEDVNKTVDGLYRLNDEKHDHGDLNGISTSVAVESQKSNLTLDDLSSACPEMQDNQTPQDSNGEIPLTSVAPHIEVNMEENDDQPRGNILPSPPGDVKLGTTKTLDQHTEVSAAEHLSEGSHIRSRVVSSFPSGDHKSQDVDRESEAISHCDRDAVAEGMISISTETCQYGQESKGSAGPLTVQETLSEPKHGLKQVEEQSKIGGMNSSSPTPLPAPLTQHKAVVGIGKSSTSSMVVISKSSVSAGCKPPGRPASPNALKPIHSTKQRAKVNSYGDIKKDLTLSGVVRDNARHESARKTTKERPKVSANTVSKTHMGRISHSSSSKRTSSDSKEQVPHPFSRASMTRNVATASSGSVDTSSNSHLQNKTTVAGLSQKGERFSQSSSQQSSKVNHSSSMHPPVPVNSSVALSDEELALLLHQELNSSPRVPRVPRVRHAGSTPQLASPTATSMLIKCTSNPGGKDQIFVSRRKNKEDAPKDGLRNSREHNDETKQMGRLPSSPDQRKQGPIFTSDGSTKKEACSGSPEVVHSAKKNVPLGPSSSTEVIDQNLSSVRNSDRDISDDDDADADTGSVPHTLPGLIDEIMSKGRHMTYEDLCDAVLPHWHNLRKHNGERYAYSSHSLAVLDCLRNRNEWAQLVDRGPKTNAGRKRRKLDPDPTITESGEKEYGKGRSSKEVDGKSVESHPDEYPKGKRKARKRRRLALQGRGIKDVRRSRKADVVTDDDIGSFSHSSEENIFSEDESQGARTCPVGSEASTSSDDTESGL